MLFRKVDKTSLDSIPSGLDIFSTPHTQVAIEKTVEKEFLTLNPVPDPPFHFKISTGTSYIDLAKTRLITQWKLTKYDDTTKTYIETAADDEINVVNGLGAVFIRNLKITVNGQQIFNSNNLYAYKAYIDNEISSSENSKKTWMNSFGYFYDNSGKIGVDVLTTEAWKDRRDLFTNGKIADFSAPLYADIFTQALYFMNNTEIEVEIHPHTSEFLIIAPKSKDTDKFKLELISVKLYGTFIDLQPGIALDVERRLDREPARYPLRRTELKTLYFEPGRTESHNTLFSDQLPRTLVVAMTSKLAFNGNYKSNPFEFLNFDVRDLRANAASNQIPFVPWELDYAKGQFVRAFEHFNRTIGANGQNIECGINRKMFANGWTIYPFNLTTSLEDMDGYDLVRDGTTDLHVRFKNDVPTSGVTVIIYAEFDSLMFIDKTRTIRTDLTL